MLIIAHRGNLNGPDKTTENTPEQILLCLSKGFHCEIDVWLINDKLLLGHDEPEHETNITFILQNANKLWCHCKHLESFQYLLKFKEINCFYHTDEDYILTSHLYIWTYPGKPVPNDNAIVVMPEWNKDIKYNKNIAGICTDYVTTIESFFIV